MKKPKQYDLKKWLCTHTITGFKVHYYQTGVDTANTDWELLAQNGNTKRVKESSVEDLVRVKPDWIRAVQVEKSVVKEIKEYDEFIESEKQDYEKYKELKKKFEQ